MTWKRRIIIGLGILVLLGLIALAVPVVGFFYPMIRQMHAGRKYMDSLTDVEIQKWIDRSKEYLAHADPKEYPIDARPVPPDLQALKILRIDLRTNSVVYVWCGGLDHTYLTVKERDGNYEVIAGYDDEHSRVIWPKKNANNAVEPTRALSGASLEFGHLGREDPGTADRFSHAAAAPTMVW